MIKRFKKGEALSAAKLNKLADAVRAATPNEGVGVNIVKGGSGGWSVTHRNPRGVFMPSGPASRGSSSTHPWKVSLSADEDDPSTNRAYIREGLIYDSLLSITRIIPTLTADPVQNDSLVCLEYTYSDQTIKSVVVPVVGFEAYTRSEGEMITVTQPLAKIVNVSGKLTVEQIARNNYEQIEACKDGYIIKYLKAL
jgi:hypothetical protein